MMPSLDKMRSVVTVEPVLFLYMLATWLSFPTLQGLLFQKVCLAKYNNSGLCDHINDGNHTTQEDIVQSTTSSYMLYSTVCLTLPSIVTATFIGSWSDKFSHKIPIILPSIGAILGAVNYIISSLYIELPIGLVLLSSVLSGLFGGFVTCILTVFSYVTTLTGTRTRTYRVSIVESMSFLGGTAGLFMSGVLLDNYGFPVVFGVILIIHVLVILYTLIWVKDIQTETAVSRGDSSCCSYLFNLEHVRQYIKCVVKRREDNSRRNMWLVMTSLFIGFLCFSGIKDISYLYVKRSPLSWSRTIYGYYQGFQMGLTAVLLIVGAPILKMVFHVHDTTLILMGIVSTIASQILYAFSTKLWMVFLVPVLGIFHGFQSASSRALVSTFVERGEQGKLFAFVGSAESLTTLFASLIFNSIYGPSLNFFPGFCFILSAALMCICVTLIIYVRFDLLAERQQPYTTFINTGAETDQADSQ
ncbi:proton-coupled folate transporter-like isoform X2 [Lineus longissimus]|uniref:proton-coupled folate transporter-like isoform X2 n=1 Tax=Lineus longissimus TaxID=88925 RepID=UPI00315D657F